MSEFSSELMSISTQHFVEFKSNAGKLLLDVLQVESLSPHENLRQYTRIFTRSGKEYIVYDVFENVQQLINAVNDDNIEQ